LSTPFHVSPERTLLPIYAFEHEREANELVELVDQVMISEFIEFIEFIQVGNRMTHIPAWPRELMPHLPFVSAKSKIAGLLSTQVHLDPELRYLLVHHLCVKPGTYSVLARPPQAAPKRLGCGHRCGCMQ
jgi:hypothetical protein